MDLFGEPEKSDQAEETSERAATEEVESEGLQNPRNMNICLGHEILEKTLIEQFAAGRLPHGLVFTGPKGIGKATFAYRLARFLLNQRINDVNQDALFGSDEMPSVSLNMDMDRNHQVFRQVAAGGHPDLLSIERVYDGAKDEYKNNVAVDDVRKVNPFLRMTASHEDGWRVVIVDDADTMNRNAQNALLKILEEPPDNTVLILVCHRLGSLIPTIRSRMRILNFQPLSKEHFEQLLQQHGYVLENDQLSTLYHLSEGSVGAGVNYIEQGGLDTLAEILGLFENWPAWSWPDIHILADQMARAGRDQSYKSFTTLLPWIFSQMIIAKARGEQITSQALHIPAIETLHRQSSLETLLKICENLKSHFDRAEHASLDKRQAVLGAFSIITA